MSETAPPAQSPQGPQRNSPALSNTAKLMFNPTTNRQKKRERKRTGGGRCGGVEKGLVALPSLPSIESSFRTWERAPACFGSEGTQGPARRITGVADWRVELCRRGRVVFTMGSGVQKSGI